jgi:hypothetical protein
MYRAFVALLAAILVTSSAPALTLIGTGTGIIFSPDGSAVVDESGIFGAQGASLIGKTATITISIDLDRTPPLYFGDGAAAVSAGAFYGFPGFDPTRDFDIGGGSITIDGVTLINAGDSDTTYLFTPAGIRTTCPGGTSCAALGTTTGPGRFGGVFSLGLSLGRISSGAPTSLFDLPLGSNLCSRATDCLGQYYDSISGFTDASVRLSSLSFAVAGVPEPATWAMMVLGFGAIGATMRRGRHSLVAAL